MNLYAIWRESRPNLVPGTAKMVAPRGPWAVGPSGLKKSVACWKAGFLEGRGEETGKEGEIDHPEGGGKPPYIYIYI